MLRLFAFFVFLPAAWGGQAPSFTGPLRLDALVAEVLARNPDVTAMRAAWDAARAHIAQESAFPDPVLSYGFAPRTIGQSDLDYGQTASLALTLPWPGKQALKGEAAGHEAEAADQALAAVRLALVEAARQAFADWFYIHRALALDLEDRRLLERLAHLARVRYASGRAARQDALRAEVEIALRAQRRLVLARRRSEIRARLNALLLRTSDAPLPEPAALPAASALPPLAQLRRQALAHHPRLRALAARLAASRQRIALARREFWPDLTLRGGYNSLWADERKRFTLGVAVNLPLPGRRRARLDQAEAEALRRQAEYHSLEAEILRQLQSAYDRVNETRRTLDLYRRRLVPLAGQSLEAARDAYAAGGGDFLDVLDAAKRLIAVRLQLARARSDYLKRLATLERLSGGRLGGEGRP